MFTFTVSRKGSITNTNSSILTEGEGGGGVNVLYPPMALHVPVHPGKVDCMSMQANESRVFLGVGWVGLL